MVIFHIYVVLFVFMCERHHDSEKNKCDSDVKMTDKL